jgi:hypothetical protein
LIYGCVRRRHSVPLYCQNSLRTQTGKTDTLSISAGNAVGWDQTAVQRDRVVSAERGDIVTPRLNRLFTARCAKCRDVVGSPQIVVDFYCPSKQVIITVDCLVAAI